MILVRRTAIVTALLLGLATGCGRDSSSAHKSESPAKVEKLPQETELARITLMAQAEQRLGIKLAPVIRETVERRRMFGGEMTIPVGKSIIVSAPLAGMIAEPKPAAIPVPGQRVEAGEPVLSLLPLLSPERYVPTPAERVQIANARATLATALTVAHGEVERSQAEVEAAKIALRRAEQLLADKAGSARAVDDAQAQLNVSQTVLAAAKQREQQLDKLIEDLDATGANGQAAPLEMTASESGVIRNLSVTRGQTVSAGSPLFEVVNTDVMWVRVPIYVDLLNEIQHDAPARLVGLDGRDSIKPLVARPIAAPPSADPLNATADLFYEVDNIDGQLNPGQRVGMELAVSGTTEMPVVPMASILYDVHGGTWVYAKVGEHAFERRRVQIQFSEGERAMLAEGPPTGTEIVTDGVAELFGTEFGGGK